MSRVDGDYAFNAPLVKVGLGRGVCRIEARQDQEVSCAVQSFLRGGYHSRCGGQAEVGGDSSHDARALRA
jgi:hypothetical protein